LVRAIVIGGDWSRRMRLKSRAAGQQVVVDGRRGLVLF
jgi:hypothetical protein